MKFKRSPNLILPPYSLELPIFGGETKARHWDWGNWGTEWFGIESCRQRQQCPSWAFPGQLPDGIRGGISQWHPFSAVELARDLLGEPLAALEVLGCKSRQCLACLCYLQSSHGDSRTDSYWDRATAWPRRWWRLREGSVSQSSAAEWRILIRTGKK